jgi:hypothetical protein
VGADDLLDDGEAEAGAFLVGGEVGFEDFGGLSGWDAGAVVADFEAGLVGSGFVEGDFDLATAFDGLHGVEKEVEEGLAEELQ